MEIQPLDMSEFDAITIGGTCIVGYRYVGPDWIREEYYLANVLDKINGRDVKVELTGRFAIEFRLANPPRLNLMAWVPNSPFSSYDSVRVYQDVPSTRQLLRDLLLTEMRREEAVTYGRTVRTLHEQTFANVLRDGLIGPAVKEAVRAELAKK